MNQPGLKGIPFAVIAFVPGDVENVKNAILTNIGGLTLEWKSEYANHCGSFCGLAVDRLAGIGRNAVTSFVSKINGDEYWRQKL